MDYHLPRYETLSAQNGVPALATPLMLRELDVIRLAAQDGTFTADIKKAHNEIAKDELRSAVQIKENIETPNSRPDYNTYRNGLSCAESVLRNIEKAAEHFTPGMIAENDRFGWGYGPKTMMYDRASAEDLQNYFILKVCGIEFAEAQNYQNKGHFVLDSSGSGHGAMTLPMQRILERLQEAKHDIRDPQTFIGMCTDIDTFWDCYRRERQAVLAAGKYTNLVKQELTR